MYQSGTIDLAMRGARLPLRDYAFLLLLFAVCAVACGVVSTREFLVWVKNCLSRPST
jgi:hypothetical protein